MLASSPLSMNLRRLVLGSQHISDGSATAIANSNLSRLYDLQLTGNELGDIGAVALAESPYLQRLLHLQLNFQSIAKKGLQALQQRFGSRLQYTVRKQLSGTH